MWHLRCSVLRLTLQAPGKAQGSRHGASEGSRREAAAAAHTDEFLMLASGFAFVCSGFFFS